MITRRGMLWPCVAGLLGSLAAPALAQNVPVYDPTKGPPNADSAPPPVPQRGGGMWLPGMPVPVGGQFSKNNPLDAEGGLKPEAPADSGRGRGEAVVRPEDYATTGISVDDPHAGEPGNVPETHLVRKGDTLWDISNAYYRNPWYWPKLWAYNPVITNPHWIYPGDVIRLKSPGGDAPALPASASGAATSALQTSRITREGTVDSGIHLRATGFVEPGELKASGRIAASKEERIMLSYLDEAYVEYAERARPKPGERLTIYKVTSEVRRPGSRDVLGHIVEIVGELEIRSVVDKHMARAVIVEALAPIERDFRVGPLKRRFDLVAPVPDRQNVDALVMAALRPSELMSEAMLVFIDRGREDGLAVGNRMMVVRRGDGYMPRMGTRPTDDKRFPREIMGEVLIVDVRSQTCTGVVMRSIKEVEVGDHLEARKGY